MEVKKENYEPNIKNNGDNGVNGTPEEFKENSDYKKLIKLTKNINNYDSLDDILDNNKFLKNCSDKTYIKAYNESNDFDKYVIKQIYYLNNDINLKSFNQLLLPNSIDGLKEININLIPGELFKIKRGNNEITFVNETNSKIDYNFKNLIYYSENASEDDIKWIGYKNVLHSIGEEWIIVTAEGTDESIYYNR